MDLTEAIEQVRKTIDDPRLLRLFSYWLSKFRGDSLPGRPDLDPLEMSYILGDLLLVDVEREPLTFRYRLTGSNLTEHLGLDLTGRTVDQHPDPTFRAQALTVYSEIADNRQPLALRRNTVMDRRLRQYQVLLLPLARDGRTVDMVMVGYSFDG